MALSMRKRAYCRGVHATWICPPSCPKAREDENRFVYIISVANEEHAERADKRVGLALLIVHFVKVLGDIDIHRASDWRVGADRRWRVGDGDRAAEVLALLSFSN